MRSKRLRDIVARAFAAASDWTLTGAIIPIRGTREHMLRLSAVATSLRKRWRPPLCLGFVLTELDRRCCCGRQRALAETLSGKTSGMILGGSRSALQHQRDWEAGIADRSHSAPESLTRAQSYSRTLRYCSVICRCSMKAEQTRIIIVTRERL